uniref:Putative secreted peptide n=1 Tax=Anopheles braziliensis TaxID=58242 RepID=A0A2M3ZTH8_9DIPT
MLEKVWQNLLLDVLCLYTVRRATLLHHLQHDLLHLLVRRLELADQDQHHLARVVVRVLGIHQRDQIPDGFQECRQTLTTMRTDTLPEGFQHGIERFDTVRGGRFSERCQRECRNRAYLLLLVHQTVLNNFNERL